MMIDYRPRNVVMGLALSLAVLMPFVPGDAAEPLAKTSSTGGPLTVRRLSETQYRNSISDIFGPAIKIDGRFEAEAAHEGLLAIGSSKATVTTAGAEYYSSLASGIADQIVSEANRGLLVPCTPRSLSQPDKACATAFVTKYGEALFRRPLTADQVAQAVALAETNAKTGSDFYKGLRYAAMSLLVAPEFLFRIELSNRELTTPQLDDWSRASRLSFLLWNGPPDAELRDLARRGELSKPDVLARQVDRMMQSPKLERSMRAFFDDAYGFQAYATLAKDSQLYPLYSQKIGQALREQDLRTVIDVVLTRDADYREVFIGRHTFLTRDLGALYRLPVEQQEGWTSYLWPENSGRNGIITSAGFLALHSHPGRSSPTLRGLAIRERFLCQSVPAPPANVDFTLALNDHDTNRPTARARLTAHMESPACAGCHKLTDPIGFGLENFDGVGQFRTTENKAPIDPSGSIGPTTFSNSIELGKAIAEHPAMPDCLVHRLLSYGLGRTPVPGEQAWEEYLGRRFVSTGFRVKALLREIARSEEFYTIDLSHRPLPQVAINN